MIDNDTLETFLKNDDDVVIIEKLDEGFFKIKTKVPDSPHSSDEYVDMLVTLKINPDFLVFFSRVEENNIAAALVACENSNLVGLISFGQGFMIRSSIFSKLSEPVAINNAARAQAMAMFEYQALVRGAVQTSS